MNHSEVKGTVWKSLLVFWMSTRMNDAVHVQVQVVKLHFIGVGLGRVDRSTDSITLSTLG